MAGRCSAIPRRACRVRGQHARHTNTSSRWGHRPGQRSKLLEISRNMIDAMHPGTPQRFPRGIRLVPELAMTRKRILAGLRHECDTRSAPTCSPIRCGGIENWQRFLAINESSSRATDSVSGFSLLARVWTQDSDDSARRVTFPLADKWSRDFRALLYLRPLRDSLVVVCWLFLEKQGGFNLGNSNTPTGCG